VCAHNRSIRKICAQSLPTLAALGGTLLPVTAGMRRACLLFTILLTLAGSARADVQYTIAKEGVGWGLVAVGLIAGVLSTALILENPNAADYRYQSAAGWSAVGLSGAALICGIVALDVPPRRMRRLAVAPNGLAVHF
jgi:hypothetical protein